MSKKFTANEKSCDYQSILTVYNLLQVPNHVTNSITFITAKKKELAIG